MLATSKRQLRHYVTSSLSYDEVLNSLLPGTNKRPTLKALAAEPEAGSALQSLFKAQRFGLLERKQGCDCCDDQKLMNRATWLIQSHSTVQFDSMTARSFSKPSLAVVCVRQHCAFTNLTGHVQQSSPTATVMSLPIETSFGACTDKIKSAVDFNTETPTQASHVHLSKRQRVAACDVQMAASSDDDAGAAEGHELQKAGFTTEKSDTARLQVC